MLLHGPTFLKIFYITYCISESCIPKEIKQSSTRILLERVSATLYGISVNVITLSSASSKEVSVLAASKMASEDVEAVAPEPGEDNGDIFFGVDGALPLLSFSLLLLLIQVVKGELTHVIFQLIQ